MLPQMMPLPWVLVFFFIFICLYTVFLSFSFFSFDSCYFSKGVKAHPVTMPW